MRNHSISLFTVVALFIYVCEESVAKSITEAEQNVAALKQEVGEKIHKQLPKMSHKKIDKENQMAVEHNSGFSELDLTIPLNSSIIEEIDYALNSQKNNYLPDLFKKKEDKEPSVQLVGKLIKREEEARGKEAISDGAGIDLKLIH